LQFLRIIGGYVGRGFWPVKGLNGWGSSRSLQDVTVDDPAEGSAVDADDFVGVGQQQPLALSCQPLEVKPGAAAPAQEIPDLVLVS
jgi:hypothetical protein